ncbi:MAG: LamG domain-containing protein [Bacteroidota bacterium]
MKVLRSVIGLSTLIVILFSLEANVSSCKKQVITDTVFIKDTIHTKDTVHIIDSVNCNCYDLSDGLVAYYNFNNGTLNDSSGNNNTIVFNNAVKTTDRFGKANNAYLFNGTSSYMQVKNSPSLNPGNITIAAIVKLSGFYPGKCHGNQIIQKGTVDQLPGVYSLRVTDLHTDCAITADTSKEEISGFYGDYGHASSVVDSADYVRTNKWINVVYTFDGVQSKIYVDGILKWTTTSNALFTSNSNDIFIGRAESSEYPYWFNGIIDEVRIYNKALCAAAVKQLYGLKN